MLILDLIFERKYSKVYRLDEYIKVSRRIILVALLVSQDNSVSKAKTFNHEKSKRVVDLEERLVGRLDFSHLQ